MDEPKRDEFEWARQELAALRERTRCCMLATVSAQGVPLSSYAPVHIDEDFSFFVFASSLAKHHEHLRSQGRASVMLIDDEAVSEELFARKRLTVDCSAYVIGRDDSLWQAATDGLIARCGETMRHLRELLDFDLFRLVPSEGRLVLGFGKAYRVWGDGLREIGFLGGGGHRSKN